MFLNIFGVHVTSSDSNKCQILFCIFIIVTCVFNLICAPWVVYEIDDWSVEMATSMTILQSRVVAVASFISRSVILYDIRFDKYRKYKTTLESFDIYSPVTGITTKRCTLLSIANVSVCLTFMLPVNIIKLYNLYYKHPDGLLVTAYFLFFYLQNFSMFLIENNFTNHCLIVYAKFREINDDLKALMEIECLDYSRFPSTWEITNDNSSPNTPPSSGIVYNKDFYRPKHQEHPLTNTVELLKIRHWLTREAVKDLNYLFGIHLGLSIFSLSALILFDVYADIFHHFTTDLDKTIFRSNLLFFGWILQYSFRFFVIAITSNITAKQGIITKTLLTDTNHRHLDRSTNEELQLFYTQLSNLSTEFTACNVFTLDNRLITSAMVTGATYLAILVQFHSSNKKGGTKENQCIF